MKSLVMIGLIYIVYPFDLMTDLIPFIGWIDDMTLGSLILALAIKLVPEDVVKSVNNGK